MSYIYIKDDKIYDNVPSVTIGTRFIMHPTHAQILLAGYKVYDPEQDLQYVKNRKLKEIDDYDTSSNVNIFYYGDDVTCWLDKATRVGLVNSTNMEKQMGRETSKLLLGNLSFEFPCDSILYMLMRIEVYAKDCYDVTALHKQQVSQMTSIEDINNFDVTKGYPEKIHF